MVPDGMLAPTTSVPFHPASYKHLFLEELHSACYSTIPYRSTNPKKPKIRIMLQSFIKIPVRTMATVSYTEHLFFFSKIEY